MKLAKEIAERIRNEAVSNNWDGRGINFDIDVAAALIDSALPKWKSSQMLNIVQQMWVTAAFQLNSLIYVEDVMLGSIECDDADAKLAKSTKQQLKELYEKAKMMAEQSTESKEIQSILRDWLKFSADVKPSCAAGYDWLNELRKKTEASLPAAPSTDKGRCANGHQFDDGPTRPADECFWCGIKKTEVRNG